MSISKFRRWRSLQWVAVVVVLLGVGGWLLLAASTSDETALRRQAPEFPPGSTVGTIEFGPIDQVNDESGEVLQDLAERFSLPEDAEFRFLPEIQTNVTESDVLAMFSYQTACQWLRHLVGDGQAVGPAVSPVEASDRLLELRDLEESPADVDAAIDQVVAEQRSGSDEFASSFVAGNCSDL